MCKNCDGKKELEYCKISDQFFCGECERVYSEDDVFSAKTYCPDCVAGVELIHLSDGSYCQRCEETFSAHDLVTWGNN